MVKLSGYKVTGRDPGSGSGFDDRLGRTEFSLPLGRAYGIVVAASNAANETKDAADYVCDGTADDVQIQAAIAALPS